MKGPTEHRNLATKDSHPQVVKTSIKPQCLEKIKNPGFMKKLKQGNNWKIVANEVQFVQGK